MFLQRKAPVLAIRTRTVCARPFPGPPRGPFAPIARVWRLPMTPNASRRLCLRLFASAAALALAVGCSSSSGSSPGDDTSKDPVIGDPSLDAGPGDGDGDNPGDGDGDNPGDGDGDNPGDGDGDNPGDG